MKRTTTLPKTEEYIGEIIGKKRTEKEIEKDFKKFIDSKSDFKKYFLEIDTYYSITEFYDLPEYDLPDIYKIVKKMRQFKNSKKIKKDIKDYQELVNNGVSLDEYFIEFETYFLTTNFYNLPIYRTPNLYKIFEKMKFVKFLKKNLKN